VVGRWVSAAAPVLPAGGWTIAAGLQAPLRLMRHDCRACRQRPGGRRCATPPGVSRARDYTGGSLLPAGSRRRVVAAVPGQEATTGDNVTLRVDAVVCYRVIDPLKAIINVQNYQFAVSQVAQTSLRSVIGQSDMDQLLSERDKVNAHLKDVIDAPTEQPWGVCVERAEGKDVALPESMKRSDAAAGRNRAGAPRGSSPPTGNTRHPRSSPRPPLSWPPTRPPCNCGCCRPSSWSPPRKQHPGHARPGRIAALSSTAQPRPPARPPASRTPAPRRRPCPIYPPSRCQPAPP
jgi:SPFH domain/Band 7 family protein